MKTNDSKTSILIVDDHAVFREGLSLLLASRKDLHIVGEAASGADAIRRTEQLRPDIVLLDLAMPDGNGIDMIPRISEISRETRTIILSSHGDADSIRTAIEKGAAGYVCKEDAFSEVVTAIAQIVDGKRYMSPRIMNAMIDAITEETENTAATKLDPLRTLSDREKTILKLICEEKYPKEIAAELSISRKTVDIHKRNIKEKLGVKTDAGLIKLALNGGYFPATGESILPNGTPIKEPGVRPSIVLRR